METDKMMNSILAASDMYTIISGIGVFLGIIVGLIIIIQIAGKKLKPQAMSRSPLMVIKINQSKLNKDLLFYQH